MRVVNTNDGQSMLLLNTIWGSNGGGGGALRKTLKPTATVRPDPDLETTQLTVRRI